MKKHISLLVFFCLVNLVTLYAQTSVTLAIDGKLRPSVNAKAAIEKVLGRQLVGIIFTEGNVTLTINFNYKSVEGKTSATITSGNYPDDLAHGFEGNYQPDKTKKSNWNILNNNTSTGSIKITNFSESKKEISGTFEAVVMEMMNDSGAFVAGTSTKTIAIKGEFKNLPFVKVN